jgi:hypothetical protein
MMRNLPMPRRIPEEALEAIAATVARRPGGMPARDIASALGDAVPFRTLQYRLKHLVDEGRLAKQGEGRWATYRLLPAVGRGALVAGPAQREGDAAVPVSHPGEDIRTGLRQLAAARKPVGDNRALLDAYRPNESFHLSAAERAHLAKVGKPDVEAQPAGAYAGQMLNRFVIDLSWNSSRLEGNSYSLPDTRRLIEFGEEAEGRNRLEAQMILNHKEAIEFLVGTAEGIGFDRHTILNLHAILANNLLPDESAAGRLRRVPLGVGKSTFHPPHGPQRIEASFDQMLAVAATIEDPFEQAFLVMLQLPGLQPFDGMNGPVSRLCANIPLIKGDFLPLCFTDVPRAAYTEAVLGVHEMNRVDLLKEVFMCAYERSAARRAPARQSLGEPDPFRLTYRDALCAVVAQIVRAGMDRKTAAAHITFWTGTHIGAPDRERFRELTESTLLSLHEGNFARYRIRLAEFAAWREAWNVGARCRTWL